MTKIEKEDLWSTFGPLSWTQASSAPVHVSTFFPISIFIICIGTPPSQVRLVVYIKMKRNMDSWTQNILAMKKRTRTQLGHTATISAEKEFLFQVDSKEVDGRGGGSI